MVALQAPASVARRQDELACAVDLSVVDALSVGHSIRALVRAQKLPPGTAEIYDRVGAQMIAAARRAIMDRGRP